MTKDEAERVAAQMTRTIPREVASVVKVENGDYTREDTWTVKCDESKSSRGGRGIYLWIHSVPEWVRLQRWWLSMRQVESEE